MSNLNDNTWLEIAESRSKNYWFLAQFYLLRPQHSFVQQISSALEANTSNTELSGLYDEIQQLQEDNEAITQLEKEYTRLFRGLREGYGPPPPYESVYRENRLFGDSTSAVMRQYQNAGFGAIDEDAGPQDHIGVELKFMSLLCYQEYNAWKNDNSKQALQTIEQQKAFLGQHLMTWLPEFCKRLINESQLNFYSIIAKLTLDSLQQELSLLDEITHELNAA